MPLQKRKFKKFGTCANPDCGKQFIRRKRGQQYCCLSCATHHQKIKEAGKKQVDYQPKFCEWCNAWFKPHYSSQKYCTTKCRDEAKRYRESKRIYKLTHPDKPVPMPEPEPKRIEKKPGASWEEVLAYMKEHNCQYRKAVRALDGVNY